MRYAAVVLLAVAGCAEIVGIQDSTELALSSLEVQGGALVPAFDPAVHSYEVSLGYSHASIEIAARALDPTVSVEIDRTTTPQGLLRSVALPVGDSTIEITGRTTSGVESVYTIQARRAEFSIELVQGPPAVGVGVITRAQAADIDGDGTSDLVYTTNNSGVGVIISDGAGGFSSGWHTQFATLRGVAVGNFVGDAATDIAVTDGSLLLLKGRGDNTFDTPFPRGLADAAAMAVGQLDGGLHNDLVVADGPGRVTALFGTTTDMTMGPTWQASAVQYEPRIIAVGNVDGAPGAEVVQLDGTTNTITVSAMSNPAAGFPLMLPAAAAPREMMLAELDGDARSEIVWIDPIIGTLNIQQATAVMMRTTIPLGGWAFGLAAGDVDGDGATDLATIQGDTLVLLHNDTHGTLTPLRYPGLAAGATGLAMADLDADGHADVIVPRGQSSIGIFHGRVP